MAKTVLTLDLGRRTGFMIGRGGEMPFDGGAWALAKPGQDIEIAVRNLGCAIRDLMVLNRPDLIVVEHFLNPVAMPSADVAIAQLRFHGVVDGLAGIYGIEVQRPHPGTARKHFIGRAHFGRITYPDNISEKDKRALKAAARRQTKDAVVQRAVQLGYINAYDEDKADAAALYDYALCAILRQKPQQPFKLFGT